MSMIDGGLMAIKDEFEKYGYADLIFDPVPSYGGSWFFDVKNLSKLSLVENGINLFDSFLQKTYLEPLEKIFDCKTVLTFKIAMSSEPNPNNIGRTLKYSKDAFFSSLVSFLNQHIDRVGKTKEDHDNYIKKLQETIEAPYEERNIEFANALKEKASKLKKLKNNQIQSEYFEAIMEDAEIYSKGLSVTEYIDNLLQATMSMQQGMIKLDNFFDRTVDYKKMAEAFDSDTFFLLFAKIIYEYNLLCEKYVGHLDNNCHYLYMYVQITSKDLKYDPKIFYTRMSGKKEKVSRYSLQHDYEQLLKRHPEAKPIVLPEMPVDDDKYKNIGLMEKIAEATNSGTASWEFLPKGERIKKGDIKEVKVWDNNKMKKDKCKLIEEVNMRIEILENSGYVISPIVGLDTFSGYYAFVYPNGKVILEKFWENVETLNPADGCATYVMSIDNFVELSKMPKLALIEYIKSFPEIGVKRIFHTSVENWQRNLHKEINGTYRFEDAIDFINNLKSRVVTHNHFYVELLKFISEEREAFNTLLDTDNTLGLNVTSDDIVNYLEFANNDDIFNSLIIGNVIITEGDILSVLRIIKDIMKYEGEYTLYINEDNPGTITYLITRANLIYKELSLNLSIKIDYSENYNKYLNELVTIIGSEDFVNTASKDFLKANKIIM